MNKSCFGLDPDPKLTVKSDPDPAGSEINSLGPTAPVDFFCNIFHIFICDEKYKGRNDFTEMARKCIVGCNHSVYLFSRKGSKVAD